MEKDLLLVPPGRLGALLSSTRRTTGEDLATLATKSSGKFDQRTLELVEKGKAKVSEADLRDLALLYKVDSGQIVPSRSHLVIDLNSNELVAGTKSVPLADKTEDEVLEQYLALLYLLRDVRPGTELTLRQPDLITLEKALSQSVTTIEHELLSLMTAPQVDERAFWLSQKVIIPSAGLLVGVAAAGSIVMLSGQQNIISTSESEVTEVLGVAPTTIEQTSRPIITAPAAQEVNPAAPTTIQEFENTISVNSPAATGLQAEALIAYDYKSLLPEWEYKFLNDRDGYRGLTFVDEKRIEIYVDPGETPGSVAEILAHEIGHAIDVEYFDGDDRNRWKIARGLPDAWWPGNGLSDFHVGAGDFAEAVAKVLVDSPSNSHHGEFTEEQLALARELLPNYS